VTGSVDQYGTVQRSARQRKDRSSTACARRQTERTQGVLLRAQRQKSDARSRDGRGGREWPLPRLPVGHDRRGIEILTGVRAERCRTGHGQPSCERPLAPHVGHPCASAARLRMVARLQVGPSPARSRRRRRRRFAAAESEMPIDLRLDADEVPLLTDFTCSRWPRRTSPTATTTRLLQHVHAPDAAATRLFGGGRAGGCSKRSSSFISRRDCWNISNRAALHSRVSELLGGLRFSGEVWAMPRARSSSPPSRSGSTRTLSRRSCSRRWCSTRWAWVRLSRARRRAAWRRPTNGGG